MYVAELVKDTNIIEAMKVFEKYGTPLNTFNTYKMLIDMVRNNYIIYIVLDIKPEESILRASKFTEKYPAFS